MVKFKDFSRPLSVFQVLFKANFIFKDFSRQPCIFKYFTSLCKPGVKVLAKLHVSTDWSESLFLPPPLLSGPGELLKATSMGISCAILLCISSRSAIL